MTNFCLSICSTILANSFWSSIGGIFIGKSHKACLVIVLVTAPLILLFIYYLLKSEYGTNEISQYVRGAVTKTITKDDVRKVKIIVPPIELQNKFAKIVEQIDKQKFVNANLLQLLGKNLKRCYNNIIDFR